MDCRLNVISNITCPDLTSTIAPVTTTTITIDLATQNYIQQLQTENYQLKVGLGVGLGGGMAITSGLAIGSYIYFSKR